MNIELGTKIKQIKFIKEFDFDYVGVEFVVTKSDEKIVMGRSGALNFGIEKDKLFDYFELVAETKNGVEFIDDNKVIRNDRATIVILKDGTKGVSKCLPEDTYDSEKGYKIALNRAVIKSLQKELKQLIK